jgi:dTDP-4-dehydrorhamnose 3,5-epimerase-like enzyme
MVECCTCSSIVRTDTKLEDCTEMLYMTSEFYTSSAVRGVRFDDPAFSIQQPLVPGL